MEDALAGSTIRERKIFLQLRKKMGKFKKKRWPIERAK